MPGESIFYTTPMRNRSTLGLGLLCGMVLLMGGCHSPLSAPAHWHQVSSAGDPLDAGRVATVTTAAATSTTLSPYRMQVLICYDSAFSSHSGIRLVSPESTIFWDPGGMFGHEGAGGYVRRNSIVDDPPTLDGYWAWRQTFTEKAMQVFEYDLSAAEHAQLYGVLDRCRGSVQLPDGFTSNWVGGQCCVGTSQFLQRYFHTRVKVSHEYFWPHSLSRELWEQPVGRVYDYRRGSPHAVVCWAPM